jgi:hypothetical protein
VRGYRPQSQTQSSTKLKVSGGTGGDNVHGDDDDTLSWSDPGKALYVELDVTNTKGSWYPNVIVRYAENRSW